MSLNHQTLERILQLQSAGKDYRIERYDYEIDLFLTEFIDGTVRKRPRNIDEHNFSKKQNVSENKLKALTPATKHHLPLSTYFYLAIVNFRNLKMRCS